MKRLLIAIAALALPVPAFAGAYRIVLDRPATGRLLTGYGGLQAADQRTPTALVRLISPGNDVDRRGTVRALVMNLGDRPFTFGPENVTLRLGDGTLLKATPVDQFEDGRMLVERESRHATTVDMANRNTISSLANQTNSGMTTQSMQPVPGGSSADTGDLAQLGGLDRRTDALMLPGGRLLDAIYQLLIPETVGPRQAWGGYYVFDVPADVRRRRADQPLSIIVRTGGEEHRFSATLHWK
ncbi:hypothetical protein ACUXST_001459 [Sphingomonas sp. F9_3S_D5_B_2]